MAQSNFFTGGNAVAVDLVNVKQVATKPAASGFQDGNIIYDRTDGAFFEVSSNAWRKIGITSNSVASLAALKEITGSARDITYLDAPNRRGFFQWDASDLSTEVTNDPSEGVYVPPDSDATGASGAWVREYDRFGGVNVEWFGAVGDGATSDSTAINAAIAYGASRVFFVGGKSYVVSSRVVPLEGQEVDGNNSVLVMAPGSAFTELNSVVELNNDNSSITNFEIDGNKANVTHSASGGNYLAGVVVRGKYCVVKNGYIYNTKTNGVLNYGSDASHNIFDTIRVENCDWTGFGNEIPQEGDVNSENLVFRNINSSGNTLGGLRLAGGKNVVVDSVHTADGNLNYFYIGDADGGLFNCKVVNSVLTTTNASTAAVAVQGTVQTGALTGNTNTCEVDFVNTKIDSGGGGRGLSLASNCSVRFANLTIENASTGIRVESGTHLSGRGVTIRNVSGEGVRLENKASLEDIVIENYGSASGTQAGIFLAAGSGGTILKNVKIGADSGETGEHGIWGVTGIVDITLERFVSFNGSGTKISFGSADLGKWTIRDCDTNKDQEQLGTWNGKALYLGSGFIWIDSTGVVRVKSGNTPPSSDTDGTIIGTQT